MGALSDQLLNGGCALHVETIHGETITVLTGKLAGQNFTAVRETDNDAILTSEVTIDPRAKRILRFRDANAPALGAQDRLRTGDGKVWKAVRRPDSGYLTTDYELVEVVPGKDQ